MKKETKISATVYSELEVEIQYTQLVGENSRAKFKVCIPRSEYFRMYDHNQLVDYLENRD